MDLLFRYQDTKRDKRAGLSSTCELTLSAGGGNILLKADYSFEYLRYGAKRTVTLNHLLRVDDRDGSITVGKEILNDDWSPLSRIQSTATTKKNDFAGLRDLTDEGLRRGEKRRGFWGVEYTNATEKVFELIHDKLKPKMKSEHLINKSYEGVVCVDKLYDFLVDYHLDKNNIKAHDMVYHSIQWDYPKKKWLKLNEQKFLPAVLDGYGIKSKYLLSALNNNIDAGLNIASVNYLVKLFGDNHKEYLNQFDWVVLSTERPPNKRTHTLKNKSEKACMLKLIGKWEMDMLHSSGFISAINEMLSLREFIEERGIPLKFNAVDDVAFATTLESWRAIKKHLKQGYRVKYNIPLDVISDIERPIILNEQRFTVNVLTTEEEFTKEGYIMKNCMGKQFNLGAIHLFVAIQAGKTRINLQYRKGVMVQSYGKANTPVPSEFFKVRDVLNERMSQYKDMAWKKIQVDHL
jgi:hypothetical protein